MVKIEYSPNSRASCQSCKSAIFQSEIRVAVSAMSPYQKGDYIMKYHHAACYSNRKDFTKFYGFRDLTEDDRERFMNEQKRKETSTSSITSRKRNSAHLTTPNVLAKKVSEVTPSKDLRRIVVNPYLKNKSISNLTITGIQYGQVCAYSNQKVSLVREPNNVRI